MLFSGMEVFMRCELCGDDAVYLVNGVVGFCDSCFATMDEDRQMAVREWDIIDIEELEDCENGDED